MSPAVTLAATHLLLLGGGHSHLAVLRHFAMRPVRGLHITLISRDVHTAYSGMLPGHLAGHYGYDEAHIDLRRLAYASNAVFVHAAAKGLDLRNNRVLLPDRPAIEFDLLSINVGSRPHTAGVSGAAENTIRVKPVDGLLVRWEKVVEGIAGGGRHIRIAVVGGGAGGVELALSIHRRLHAVLADHACAPSAIEIHLVTDTAQILPSHNPRVRTKFERILGERRIHVHIARAVREVRAGLLSAVDGFALHADFVFWATHAAAHVWLRDSGLATDDHGFVLINDCLQSVSHPHVFAAGDAATSQHYPRPKSGVFAVRQGPPLAHNLRRTVLGKALRPFRPQRQFLSLISTGNRYAVASRSFWSLEGRWVWRWKDSIDRRFMARYARLPVPMARMPRGAAAETAMRCAGCAAKISGSVLAQALADLRPVTRADVEMGLEAMEDGAVIKASPEKRQVWSIDYFRALVSDDYVLGQIVANHCLGDLYAMGAEPQAALAVATLPHADASHVRRQLHQLLSGAVTVLNAANATLAGGHSSEGAELAFGLSVLGVIDPDAILRKEIADPEGALILTKPIGTGTLFAAEMRGRAKGRWINAAVESMLVSNRNAALALIAHGASACTDITGFGLLGHLAEMLRTWQVSVNLNLDTIPILDGALATIHDGIESSLQTDNLHAARHIDNAEAGRSHPVYPLLFDPQTAGPLLACVPAAKADACVQELRTLGFQHATIIGHTQPSTGNYPPVHLLSATN